GSAPGSAGVSARRRRGRERAHPKVRERTPAGANAAMAPDQPGAMVPPAGFEPAISTLKGWRPGPLDDGGSGAAESSRGPMDRGPYDRQTSAKRTVTVRQPIAASPNSPPPTASSIARPV